MEIINEELARRGWEMGHMSDYKPGSATEEYNSYVAAAEVVVAKCKKETDAIFHGRIDHLFEVYCAKIADCINERNRIDASCPSVLISGPANFPVRKKERQIAAWRRNNDDFAAAAALLDRIRSVGRGGVSADDPDAVAKLKAKLAAREQQQIAMKEFNKKARKTGETPNPSWMLSNNSAEIRRLKKRIEELENKPHFEGGSFAGGAVEVDEADNRVRIRHDEKPAQEVLDKLKSNGFRWSPRNGAWQRQITPAAMRAARRIVGGVQA